MLPVFFPCSIILVHDSIVNGWPRRQDITFDDILFGMWNSFHDFVCSGKREGNLCMKVLLDVVNCVSINDLDAMSAILLFSPWICTTCKGAAWWMCCLSANALRRCPAIVDVGVLFLLTHCTVDMLLQNMPTWAYCKFGLTFFSRMSHARMIPANSRSFMDIFSFVLFDDTNSCLQM